MADSPLPTTWKEAVPYIVWGILIFSFGLEGVVTLVEGKPWVSVGCFVAMLVLAAMALHSNQLKTWFLAFDARWLVGTLLVALLGIILSPFVEQRRWPFTAAPMISDQKPPVSPASPKPLFPPGSRLNLMTSTQIVKEIDDLHAKIDELTKQSPIDGDATKSLRSEKDKAIKDRDAAIQELQDKQRELNATKRELSAARDAATARVPGTLTLNPGEIGGAVLLYRGNILGNSTFEVTAKSANVKTVEFEPYSWTAAMPGTMPICVSSCVLVRFIFDGSYGPFYASITDPSAVLVVSVPKITITKNGQVHLEAVIEPAKDYSTTLSQSNLHELRISLRKIN